MSEELDRKYSKQNWEKRQLPIYKKFNSKGQPSQVFQEKPLTPQQEKLSQFTMQFNNKFNEQFNRDYNKQAELLQKNKRFTRTRQSLEVERMDRVGVITDNKPYNLFEENTLKPTNIRQTLFGNSAECNVLNQVFFSAENIENIQNLIRYNIYISSNKQHIIGRQSDTDLVIIMKSLYLTYGKNNPNNIKEQVRDLNDLVVQEATSKILSEIQTHLYYLYDASSQPIPISRPTSMSSIGLKTLPSVTSVFFT